MMTEFFKPLQRKLGLVTLVTALAFMAGWMRSQRTIDVIHVLTSDRSADTLEMNVRMNARLTNPMIEVGGFRDPSAHSFASIPGGIMWERLTSRINDPVPYASIFERFKFETFAFHRSRFGSNIIGNLGIHKQSWRFNWLGIRLGAIPIVEPGTLSERIMWIIPYWTIVIPLTALSAYLLLSKPRKSNQKKIVEPISDEGK